MEDNEEQIVFEALYGDKDNTYVTLIPSILDTSYALWEMSNDLDIKDIAERFTRWAYDFNGGELVKGPVSGRRLLQVVGTEFFRNEVSSTFWVDLMKGSIEAAKAHSMNIIVDDTRFPDEFELLSSMGFVMVKIRGAMPTDLTLHSNTHDSETSLNSQLFDIYLLNDKSKGFEPIHKFVQGII